MKRAMRRGIPRPTDIPMIVFFDRPFLEAAVLETVVL